jgi:uncharacterized protein YjbI with pentapeptide repeats
MTINYVCDIEIESHDREVQVPEVKSNFVRFGDLAIELGLSNAELVTKSFKLGIRVITADIANYLLAEVEANLLRVQINELVSVEPDESQLKKKSIKKKSKPRIETSDLTTPEMFAKFYQKEIGEVITFCNSYGFNIEHPNQRLTIKQINLLYKQFDIAELLKVDNLGAPLQSTFGNLLREASSAPEAKSKSHVNASHGKQRNKRISVLADELNVQEVTLRWLIGAVRVNVLEGKQPKIDVRYESLIRTACEVWAQLPEGTNMVDRMRVSKIAKRSGLEVKDLMGLSSQFNIQIQNKSFVSAADGVYLQTLCLSHKVEVPASREEDVVPMAQASLSEDRVQYHKSNYVRQNFTNVKFNGSDFKQVNFGYSDVSNADFSGCLIVESQLIRVTAVGAIFDDSKILNCSFDFADLTGASFLNSELSAVSFRKATFAKTIWIDGRLINSESEI